MKSISFAVILGIVFFSSGNVQAGPKRHHSDIELGLNITAENTDTDTNQCPSFTCEPCEMPTTTHWECPECPTPEPCLTPTFPTTTTCQPCVQWTCLTCPTCAPCDNFTITTPPPCTTPEPWTCPSCPPCTTEQWTTTTERISNSPPMFTKTFYMTSLGAWPTAGTSIHLNILAEVEEGFGISYDLLDPPGFVSMNANRDLLFVTDVAEGAYVGPNNVMILEIAAFVTNQPMRRSAATVAVVFPKTFEHSD